MGSVRERSRQIIQTTREFMSDQALTLAALAPAGLAGFEIARANYMPAAGEALATAALVTLNHWSNRLTRERIIFAISRKLREQCMREKSEAFHQGFDTGYSWCEQRIGRKQS